MDSINKTRKSVIVPLLIVGSMNAVLGFALGVNAFFIPFVQQAFNVTTSMSYLIMVATFSAYLVFGGATGPILKKVGYKRGMVLALLLMAVGFLMIVPSAKMVSFPLFLAALFVNGLGQALLTGSYSTYVSIIGNPASAAARISVMGIFAKVFYAIASLILAFFIDLSNVRITDTITPFYIIAVILFMMGIVYYFSPLPEIKAIGEDMEDTEDAFDDNHLSVYAHSKTSIWQFPHLILGVVAIFFTVGAEYLALGTINDFAQNLGLPNPQNYVWLVSFSMILGYTCGVLFIPKYLSQTRALVVSTLLGIAVTLLILLLRGPVSIYLVPVLGLANALLWPSVWPLAIQDLGKFTKTGSSLLVTGIIGAGIIPLIFGFLAEKQGYQFAYIVGFVCYFYILYFALWGSKIRTKQIPGAS
ncbi:MAG: sugar MFS transporter [Bacteroidales bacterium]|nr:sugar MFS transporter [Bacteroidales bacterium]